MYLISLIIPIYNAEKYLDETINYVINQSIGFENIELILVDDNSKDNSKKIIEKYAEKYNNIIPYYSNENHGYPGFGRNIGLKKSTAEFIMFMDNDDKLDEHICKTLFQTITNENADFVCCDIANVEPLGERRPAINYINGTETKNYVLITDDDILLLNNSPVWNKIFRKKIIAENNITFHEKSRADDFIFTIDYSLFSKKLIYLKGYYGYYWNQRSDSLSQVMSVELMNDLIDANYIILDSLKKKNKDNLAEYIFRGTVIHLIMQSSYLKANWQDFKYILKKIHNFEKEIHFSLPLDSKWMNTINYFILHENYGIVIFFLRTLNHLRTSRTLRNISRRMKK